jgi:hypothetical protein
MRMVQIGVLWIVSAVAIQLLLLWYLVLKGATWYAAVNDGGLAALAVVILGGVVAAELLISDKSPLGWLYKLGMGLALLACVLYYASLQSVDNSRHVITTAIGGPDIDTSLVLLVSSVCFGIVTAVRQFRALK